MDPLRLSALALAEGRSPSPSNITRVARETSSEAASWAFTQWELRKRGAAKFSRAEDMLFTRAGLEMASSEAAARFHAHLFGPGGEFLDATCGIGSDAGALAGLGSCDAYDLDPEALICARHNLELWDQSARLHQGDSMAADWAGRRVFIDPARREGSRRLASPDAFSPPWGAVMDKAKGADEAWIKTSPLVSDDLLEAAGGHLLFLSQKGECSEALVQAGRAALEPIREAVHLESGMRLAASLPPTQAGEPLGYVLEADPAAIRAHAWGAFGLESLGDAPGWLTGGTLPEPTPFLVPYEVLWSGPWRPESLPGEISLSAVKTKGLPRLDPAKILKESTKKRSPGGETAILFLYAEGPKVKALLARRLT